MFEYGMKTDDPAEQKKYLKKGADEGYIPATYHYGTLLVAAIVAVEILAIFQPGYYLPK
jgi:hypothetical protein